MDRMLTSVSPPSSINDITSAILSPISSLSAVNPQLHDGDIAMMIMATTFVMLQTPAMGIAQAGMIRRKNALSMLMQTLTGMAIGSVLWYFVGFALVFGNTAGGFIGNPFDTFGFFFRGVSHLTPNPNAAGAADTIPGTLLAAFQMMFALMVPVIVTGAWAERMTFGAFLIFVILWPFFVYYPLAHWVWNNNGFLAKWGVIDFAGGITIHTATGLAALAVTKVLEARKNHQHIVHQHHNLPLSTLGAALIWGGWYSFNGGSAYKANFQAASALLNTHISACTGGLTWVMLARFEGGKWPLSSIINGAFAGLAGITAGSGLVPSQAAFGIGILCATAGYFTVKLRLKLGLDDVCEVIGLQGAPGFIGSILVGFAAKADYSPCSPTEKPHCCSIDGAGCGTDGLFFGGSIKVVGKQIAGASLAAAWAFGWTYVIMQIIARTVGCEVSPDQEEKGLDETQIGELGYDHDLAGTGEIHHSHDKTAVAHDAEKLCEAAAVGDIVALHRLLLFSEADAASVDYDLRSPAHIAAAHGHLNFLKELYRFGCPLTCEDRWGNTPMKEAISNSQDKVLSWLVEEGVQESENSLVEQLCEASASGDAQMVRRLIAAGADVDQGDYDFRTAMHLCCAENKPEILEILLSVKANPGLLDRWQHRPLDDALRINATECIKLLEEITPPLAECTYPRNEIHEEDYLHHHLEDGSNSDYSAPSLVDLDDNKFLTSKQRHLVTSYIDASKGNNNNNDENIENIEEENNHYNNNSNNIENNNAHQEETPEHDENEDLTYHAFTIDETDSHHNHSQSSVAALQRSKSNTPESTAGRRKSESPEAATMLFKSDFTFGSPSPSSPDPNDATQKFENNASSNNNAAGLFGDAFGNKSNNNNDDSSSFTGKNNMLLKNESQGNANCSPKVQDNNNDNNSNPSSFVPQRPRRNSGIQSLMAKRDKTGDKERRKSVVEDLMTSTHEKDAAISKQRNQEQHQKLHMRSLSREISPETSMMKKPTASSGSGTGVGKSSSFTFPCDVPSSSNNNNSNNNNNNAADTGGETSSPSPQKENSNINNNNKNDSAVLSGNTSMVLSGNNLLPLAAASPQHRPRDRAGSIIAVVNNDIVTLATVNNQDNRRPSLIVAPNDDVTSLAGGNSISAFPSPQSMQAAANSLKKAGGIDAGARELCAAAGESNLKEVRRLLKKKANPLGQDYDGRCSLHICACVPGNLEVLQALVEGAVQQQAEAAQIAARKKKKGGDGVGVGFGADEGTVACLNVVDRFMQTPLHEAIAHGNDDMAEFLRENGGIVVNTKKGHVLCKMAAKGDVAGLKAMKAAGVDLTVSDYDMRTALHLAACEDRIEVVKYLLKEGGFGGKFTNPTDRFGGTPLNDAIRHDNPEIAILLQKAAMTGSSVSPTPNDESGGGRSLDGGESGQQDYHSFLHDNNNDGGINLNATTTNLRGSFVHRGLLDRTVSMRTSLTANSAKKRLSRDGDNTSLNTDEPSKSTFRRKNNNNSKMMRPRSSVEESLLDENEEAGLIPHSHYTKRHNSNIQRSTGGSGSGVSSVASAMMTPMFASLSPSTSKRVNNKAATRGTRRGSRHGSLDSQKTNPPSYSY